MKSPARWHWILLCALLSVSTLQAKSNQHKKPHGRSASQTTWGESPPVQALAQELAQSQGLPLTWTVQRLAQAHPVPSVRQLILPAPSPTAKNWAAYRDRFIEPKRIEAGLRFWQQHQAALQRAEKTYGVPAEMVVGIIGVETYYGRHMGKFSVLDVLSTLALDFPPEHPRAAERQAFFKSELGAFLKQSRQGASIKRQGSFAGAMGWPQFMPSSWTQFAVDFDGDGHIDLLNSPVDAIGSVAHYFASFGWTSGMPTHFAVDVSGPDVDMATLMAPDILPTFSATRMAELGAKLDATGQTFDGQLALIELKNGGDPASYVAGTPNFYVITRYNWSSYYAMAVIELGQAVKVAYKNNSKH
jgi:membrane-bound lytic murein transglycosylase B